MNYRDLDIHGRINLKGTYEQFLRIAVERFQRSQEKKIYSVRTKGKRKLTRTRYLNKNFQTSVSMLGGKDRLQITFPLYGRFVDMGVGRGTNVNLVKLSKRYRAHRRDTKRQPRRWYSKTKASQEKALAQILSKRYGVGLVNLAENLLSQTITIQ